MNEIDSFATKAAASSIAEVNRQIEIIFEISPEDALHRLDEAVSQLEISTTVGVANEHPFRRRETMDVLSSLGSMWFNGYWGARANYGTALTTYKYSHTSAEADLNAQRLHGFVQSVDILDIYRALPAVVRTLSHEIEHEAMFRVFNRRLGADTARAVLTTTWAYGVATAIGEHSMFIEPVGK